MNDDQILTDGIMTIRKGIMDGNWQTVCDGYNSITTEGLEPPVEKVKPKSKIDKIREAIAKNNDDTEVIDQPVFGQASNWQGMNVKQIHAKLFTLGALPSIYKGMKPKSKLVEYATQYEAGQNNPNVHTVPNQNGKFAKGSMTIISTGEEPMEKQHNKNTHKRINHQKRRTELQDTAGTNQDIEFGTSVRRPSR